VDRFLLVGRKLESKLEVRFQRSRRRGGLQNKKDTLGARDLDGNPFVEPTQKLGFLRDQTDCRFRVLLVPTQVAGVQRWQIFAENAVTRRMDSYNIERSDDGLFNTRVTVSAADVQGAAVSAISVTHDTSITLAKLVQLGTSFTIEAWINESGGQQVILNRRGIDLHLYRILFSGRMGYQLNDGE